MRRFCALLVSADDVEHHVSVRTHAGATPVKVVMLGITYVYTSERTQGGWRVYRRAG